MKRRLIRGFAILTIVLCAGLLWFTGCGGGIGGGGSTYATSGSSEGASPSPETGEGTFSGRILDALGNGIPAASIGATVIQSSSQTKGIGQDMLVTATDSDGNFSLTSLEVNVNYLITIVKEGHKTLKSKIKLKKEISALSVLIVAPEGSGEVEFTMPLPLNLHLPVTDGNNTYISWENSINPGFLAYVLYRSQASGISTANQQIAIKMAPNDISFTDNVTAGTPCYYRLYEKVLIPELGAFIMVGSNEVASVYPQVTSFTPEGDNVQLDSRIEITFSSEMNKLSVEEGFSITSDVPGDIITGSKTWDGNTLIFTPSSNLGYGRKVTVTLSNARDSLGNSLFGAASWSFNVKSGYNLSIKWGSQGSGDGQFNGPKGIALDSSGNVYVADSHNHRVQIFDSNGNFITKWGSQGSGDGQFNEPSGIALDSSGNVYVSDSFNYRVQKFDSNGNFLTKWGSQGSGDGQFNWPRGIALDSSGNVYVSDSWNYRIQKFDSNGNFLTKWGSQGSGDGQFQKPSGVAADSSDNIYVADSDNGRIQKFDSNGNFRGIWVSHESISGLTSGVAVDSTDNIYVINSTSGRIMKYDPNGNFITKWNVNNLLHVAVDSSGKVYVTTYYAVEKFIPDP